MRLYSNLSQSVRTPSMRCVYEPDRGYARGSSSAAASAAQDSTMPKRSPRGGVSTTSDSELAVAGSDAAGRRSPHNHAQTVRNLKRSLRKAAAGARLIHAEGLDGKSGVDVAAAIGRKRIVEKMAEMQPASGRRLSDCLVDSLMKSMTRTPGVSDSRPQDASSWYADLPHWLRDQFSSTVS